MKGRLAILGAVKGQVPTLENISAEGVLAGCRQRRTAVTLHP